MLRLLLFLCILISTDAKIPPEAMAIMRRTGLMSPMTPAPPFEEVDEEVSQRLLLTPYIKRKEIDTARNLSLVDFAPFPRKVVSHSGYITVDEEMNSNLFFWFFPHELGTAPLVLWLEGGPGISMMNAVMSWIGPFKVDVRTGNFTENRNTWHDAHSVLYVDSPVGVGFSFTDSEYGYSTSTPQVAQNLYKFLLQFFELFPEMKATKFFIAGQSYGGKTAPVLAETIHGYNSRPTAFKINLSGVALWNAFLDPKATLDISDIVYYLGLVDEKIAAALKDVWNKYSNKNTEYYDLYLAFQEIYFLLGNANGDVSKYNYLTYFHYSFISFDKIPYLREAVHVGNTTYKDVGDNYVFVELLLDIMAPYMSPWLEVVLNEYPVLMVSGQLDLQVPYTQNMKAIRSLNWRGSHILDSVERKVLNDTSNAVIGYSREVLNFTEVFLRNAGHIVFEEQGWRAKFIMKSFTNGLPFFILENDNSKECEYP